MIASILRFFRFSDQVEQSPARATLLASPAFPVSPDTSITYKPKLVPELIAEHQALLGSFGALVAAHSSGDYDSSINRMNQFTGLLRAHLLKENLHLYVYLKHALQHDSESSELMAGMRSEMGTIGRALNQFVTKYTTAPWDASTRAALGSELSAIGGVLQRRIRQEEENLYTMYMPPSSYR